MIISSTNFAEKMEFPCIVVWNIKCIALEKCQFLKTIRPSSELMIWLNIPTSRHLLLTWTQIFIVTLFKMSTLMDVYGWTDKSWQIHSMKEWCHGSCSNQSNQGEYVEWKRPVSGTDHTVWFHLYASLGKIVNSDKRVRD